MRKTRPLHHGGSARAPSQKSQESSVQRQCSAAIVCCKSITVQIELSDVPSRQTARSQGQGDKDRDAKRKRAQRAGEARRGKAFPDRAAGGAPPVLGLGYHTLIDELAVEWGLSGCVKDEQPVHVSLFIPPTGPVSADQFVEWVFLANNLNPNSGRDHLQRQKEALRAAFVRHMGTETVDARRLRWDEYEAQMRWLDNGRPG